MSASQGGGDNSDQNDGNCMDMDTSSSKVSDTGSLTAESTSPSLGVRMYKEMMEHSEDIEKACNQIMEVVVSNRVGACSSLMQITSLMPAELLQCTHQINPSYPPVMSYKQAGLTREEVDKRFEDLMRRLGRPNLTMDENNSTQ